MVLRREAHLRGRTFRLICVIFTVCLILLSASKTSESQNSTHETSAPTTTIRPSNGMVTLEVVVKDHKVTVGQLEGIVAQVAHKPDNDAARQIEMRTLTERISRTGFEKLEAELHGEKSREALLVLADASAFLDLPAGEIPTFCI